MSDHSNAIWERQPEVLPAPKPPSCTIALPNGLSIPLLALHNVQLPQPPPPHDPTCTFHIYPHLPSNCKFCRGVDDYLGCWMDSGSLPVAASPSQSGSSVPGDDCFPLTMDERSSSFSPIPLQLSPPRTSKTKEKAKASPKKGVVPAHMMSVLRTGTQSERSSSRRFRGPAPEPPSSTSTLEPSLAHRTSPCSRRTFGSAPPPFAAPPAITDVSMPPTTPAAFSPRTSCSAPVSPPVLKRRRSLTAESAEPVELEAGPSSPKPRPAKQPRLSVPGESALQLDVQAPTITSSSSSGPPMGRTRQRVDYSACKCRNRTSKPARHWKTACPYNPHRHSNRVPCELCGMTFTRHDNMDRHMEDYH